MSDTQREPDWWRASDGRWYPPETHPDHRPAPPPPSGEKGLHHRNTTDGATAGGPVVSGDPTLDAGGPRPFWSRWWFWAAAALLTAVVLGAVFWSSGEGTDSTPPVADADEPMDGSDGDTNESATSNDPTSDSADDAIPDDPEMPDEPITVEPLPVDANPAIGAAGIDELPAGKPGGLTVVATGRALTPSGSLPVVVRNMTDRPVAGIEVTGTARDADGSLVASGSDQGFKPFLVAPGEIAIGYVYFGTDNLPEDAKFELSGTGRDPDKSFGHQLDLTVEEHNATAESVVVLLRNETDDEIAGPISLLMMCFDADGVPGETHSTFTDQDAAAPGATVSASFEFWGESPCERYIFGGSGYDF